MVHSRRATNHYDGEIRYTDEQIGRVFAQIRDLGVWDKTVVVLVGDHGEGLNQHGEPGHGLVWDEQLHVPFMIRVPGVAPRRFGKLVSAVDVIPTMLGLVQLPGEEMFLGQVSGRDVSVTDFVEEPIFSMTSTRQQLYGVPQMFALTTPEWKYLCFMDGQHRLYSLKDDPFELKDVADPYPQRVAEYCAMLSEMGKRQLTKSRDFGTTTAPLSRAERDQLGALGYSGTDEEDEATDDGAIPVPQQNELKTLGYIGGDEIREICSCPETDELLPTNETPIRG